MIIFRNDTDASIHPVRIDLNATGKTTLSIQIVFQDDSITKQAITQPKCSRFSLRIICLLNSQEYSFTFPWIGYGYPEFTLQFLAWCYIKSRRLRFFSLVDKVSGGICGPMSMQRSQEPNHTASALQKLWSELPYIFLSFMTYLVSYEHPTRGGIYVMQSNIPSHRGRRLIGEIFLTSNTYQKKK